MMVDGYNGNSQAEPLSTEDFYAGAQRALAPDGILVVNLWSSDRHFDLFLQRIERSFATCVCLPAERKGNVIAFGFCRAPRPMRWAELRSAAKDLEARIGLEFPRMVEALKEMNPHTDKALTFHAEET
jgi:spermidine synthase